MKTRDEMIDALVNDILTWDETTVREWAMQVYESGLEAEDDEAIEAAYRYQIGGQQ
jgi:hypothetical protein